MEPKLYNLEYNTIDIYLQKSAKFLFPLLKIKASENIKQIQSYVAWKDLISINEYKIICVYELSKNLEYTLFEKNILLKNEFFESYFEGADNKGIYIFNLISYKEDFAYFLKGRYSLFSIDVKNILKEFYSRNKFSTAYLDSFLNPEKYFEKYAALLNIDEWRLRSVGELVDPLNKMKETLIMEKAVKTTIAA